MPSSELQKKATLDGVLKGKRIDWKVRLIGKDDAEYM
jgi:hypothetical protein